MARLERDPPRSSPAGRSLSGLTRLLTVAVLLGCDSKLIHLGDGRGAPEAGPTEAGSDFPGPDAGPDLGAVDAGPPCEHGAVAANEVLWIGDGWIVSPGVQVTDVRDRARAIGAIGPNDEYVVGAGLGAAMSAIANQYSTKESAAPTPKVLIMDGGTLDTLVANGSDASVKSAASTFTQFLDQVAADGTVKHIVYFLPPELPKIFGVAALRPLVQQACAESLVPCHFIDLQGLWLDPATYTADNGILPTVAGAQVLAGALWATMQQNCIGQ